MKSSSLKKKDSKKISKKKDSKKTASFKSRRFIQQSNKNKVSKERKRWRTLQTVNHLNAIY